MLVATPVNHSTSADKSKSELFPKCSSTKQVAYPFSGLKSSQSVLDYHELRRLQAISEGSDHRDAAHRIFMSQYSAVLKPSEARSSRQKDKENRRETRTAAPAHHETNSVPVLPNLERTTRKRSRKTTSPLRRDVQTLRRNLRKLHVQRTPTEHKEIFEILQKYTEFLTFDHRHEFLQQIAEVAHLEICEEVKQPILPSAGFFIVLKGSVTMQSAESETANNLIMSESSPVVLGVGKSFGHVAPNEENSKRTWFITNEENCEFLKIDKDEFLTIKTKFEQVEYQAKYSLVRSCGEYKLWSKQTIDEIVRLIEWNDYPANTILASEGFRCPFLAFIQSGECHVLRKVDVLKTAQNGTKSRQIRQVVMGKLKAADSFGEISVLSQEAMTCTVVTASVCRLGIVRPEKASNLPEVTRKLFLHTAQRTYAHLSQDDIRHEYINQETRKEWTNFKKDIISDVIFRKDIREGLGKWQHSHPTPSANANNRLTRSSMH